MLTGDRRFFWCLRRPGRVTIVPMSLYSRLLVDDDECPHCHSMIRRTIQFAYGDTRLVDYRLGQCLQWGGNDVGERGHRRVRVSGFAESCAVCGEATDTLYEVVIERDCLTSVQAVGTSDQELALFGPAGHRIENE
jgi:hypothetical protein